MRNTLSITHVAKRDVWDSFLADIRPHTFLHSWNWGEFNRETGSAIRRLGFFEGDALFGIALVVTIRAQRGSFLFCPHGPLIHPSASRFRLSAVLRAFRDFLIPIAEKERASFIRLSPLLGDSEEKRNIFRELGFINAPIHMHPERAWMLDVTKPEDVLLQNMRKQTRHCIRNSVASGVTVRLSADPRDTELFYTLYQDTVRRQDFIPFSQEYMRDEFISFAKDGNALIFLGMREGHPISGAIVLFSHSSAFYHHGASSRAHQKIPASHLVQWEIIKEAKRRGCALYNFWGIAPEGAKNHPWDGLSLFKKGFGGFSEEYIRAQDFAVSKKYWITYAIEYMRNWKRGL